MFDVHVLASKHFNIQLPVFSDELKRAFRRAAKTLHSDVGGTDQAFVAMKAAYDAIRESGLVLTGTSQAQDRYERTIDGTRLDQLGLGLGPTVNGRECDSCQGKGYHTSQDVAYKKCPTCDGGSYVYVCRDCKGTKRFRLRNGYEVPCRRCNAQGYIPVPVINAWWARRPAGAIHCPTCIGTGRVGEPIERYRHYTCGACEGKGEIKIHNPVLMKGAIAFHMSQSQRKKQNR